MNPLRTFIVGIFVLPLLSIDAKAESTNDYLQFVRGQAAALRANDQRPADAQAWQKQKRALRENLLAAWGGFPRGDVPLSPRKLGEVERDGYRVEKIIFQTLPGVWMTANAYIPTRNGRSPALLMVHGHWRGAKQDPVVQSRCIGAAKLGFFVLAVDAFGAGERGVGRALGEYHGDMTAATLLPIGLPLSGLQVYENMRAVDYLLSRPEVDGNRIGITGASGGGNQTMYAAAWDERFAAAVPVCSVGNYQAYLGAACCMCEVVPGALKFTEESAVLGMVAPRALMVINASRDARQFSVEEARKSISGALPSFQLYGKSQDLRHTTFESGHDYSQPMREAVYGWMTRHLKENGSGDPISEPTLQTEDPETLRCFPGESRPDDWMTIPKFAAARAREIVATTEKRSPSELRRRLTDVLGGFPAKQPLHARANGGAIHFSPEPGIDLTAYRERADGGAAPRLAIIVDLEGQQHATNSSAAKSAADAGWEVLTVSLRATGELKWPSDQVRRAPDHTSAQWGLWIGRPLMGQWVWDIRRTLDAIKEVDGKLPEQVVLIGYGPGGVVALAAAALDKRITGVATIGTLQSYITDVPYGGQRMGIMVPGILKEVGDISDIAGLVTPKPIRVSADRPEIEDLFKSRERRKNFFGR